MATKNKTTATAVDVRDFINTYVDKEQKKADSFQLIELMTKWSGVEPKMWGPTIIGFGSYHYKYASGHEGDAPLAGLSNRVAQISIYVYPEDEMREKLLSELGKAKSAKACIYIKKVEDINIDVLKKIIKNSVENIKKIYG